jgi:Ca-activated chloride channel family protein
MKRSNVNKQMAVLAALGVVFTACAGDDDGSDDASSSETLVADGGRAGRPDERPASTDAPTDDLREPVDETTDAEADFGDAPASTSAPSAEGVEESATDREGGGLFAPDEPPANGGGARFEDNRFEDYGYREFIQTTIDPLSTFALDVDTGSYSIARRWIDEDALPPRESVRPEEYVNAFDYGYHAPRRGLDITVEGGPSPFDEDNHLVRIGVQAEIVDENDRGPAALIFVIDTSGSMDRDDRLGLVKDSLEILVDELQPDDTVAIVTYSDSSGVVLEPTPVSDAGAILDAIDRLGPGGSTNLEAGLREGYTLAREAFREDGINRVVLASDGVANVGVTDPDSLAAMIREDADDGIDLVTVGYGMGNFNDVTMEQLADQGDGFYAYVDTEDEAERLFQDELTSTLLTVAKDAKIQVEFDEDVVEAYRLIGFENRGVRDSDFRNDDVDAGELGAGHQVTAIYELELERGVDLGDRDEIGVVSLRWEDPESGEVTEIDEDIDLRDVEAAWPDASDDFHLAIVVATFAEVLRDNPYADDIDIDELREEADRLAEELGSRDVDELAGLIERAADLS